LNRIDARARAWTIGIAALVAVLFAGIGAGLTDLGPWYVRLAKPNWQPPDALFGPAWTLIFALCATAAVRGWEAMTGPYARRRLVALFIANLLLNALWSLLFFSLRRPDWALLEVAVLWLSILALIRLLAPVDRPGAWMLVPYLAWVSFASVLNLTIVRLNAPFR
jgi:tryptophan-rich sensory protein